MKKEIISQYKASLKMLKDVTERCPEELWDNKEYKNTYWRIVHHTLFYASFYLDPAKFSPWEKHKPNYNRLGSTNENNEPIIIEEVYSKSEMLEYLESIYNKCENSAQTNSLDDKSGIEWLPTNKGEVHLYNIRHIQHHAGQLIERLHHVGIRGIKWERMVSE